MNPSCELPFILPHHDHSRPPCNSHSKHMIPSSDVLLDLHNHTTAENGREIELNSLAKTNHFRNLILVFESVTSWQYCVPPVYYVWVQYQILELVLVIKLAQLDEVLRGISPLTSIFITSLHPRPYSLELSLNLK